MDEVVCARFSLEEEILLFFVGYLCFMSGKGAHVEDEFCWHVFRTDVGHGEPGPGDFDRCTVLGAEVHE